MRMKDAGCVALVIALCSASGCGDASDQEVTAEVTSASKTPFHGPTGPGGEPISITFSWTVAVNVGKRADCQVEHIVTTLTEPESATVLSVGTDPSDSGRVRGGATGQYSQSTTGLFSSALFQRTWQGQTWVYLSCVGSLAREIQARFVIP